MRRVHLSVEMLLRACPEEVEGRLADALGVGQGAQVRHEVRAAQVRDEMFHVRLALLLLRTLSHRLVPRELPEQSARCRLTEVTKPFGLIIEELPLRPVVEFRNRRLLNEAPRVFNLACVVVYSRVESPANHKRQQAYAAAHVVPDDNDGNGELNVLEEVKALVFVIGFEVRCRSRHVQRRRNNSHIQIAVHDLQEQRWGLEDNA
jgi:hypothetical protein